MTFAALTAQITSEVAFAATRLHVTVSASLHLAIWAVPHNGTSLPQYTIHIHETPSEGKILASFRADNPHQLITALRDWNKGTAYENTPTQIQNLGELPATEGVDTNE